MSFTNKSLGKVDQLTMEQVRMLSVMEVDNELTGLKEDIILAFSHDTSMDPAPVPMTIDNELAVLKDITSASSHSNTLNLTPDQVPMVDTIYPGYVYTTP